MEKNKKTVDSSIKRKKNKKQGKGKKGSGNGKTMVVGDVQNQVQQKRTAKPTQKPHPAPTVVSTIAIVSTMCPQARQTWSCALISRLAMLNTGNLNSIYYAYQVMDADFVDVVTSSIPAVNNRLAFVNTLFELIKPKTITTSRLNVSYQFDATTLSGNPTPTILIRGQNFFIYNPGVDDGGSLTLMVVPPALTLAAALPAYNLAVSQLVGNTTKQMLKQQPIESTSKVFTHDASGYAQGAQYVNSLGGCTAGGYRSAESEVYCGALCTLSSFVALPSQPLRAAHNFQFASLDVTAAFGMPYLDDFKMLDYSTRLAPIIKYIDLSQLWVVWIEWLSETVRKAYSDPQNQVAIDQYFTPAQQVPLEYAIIAFRQTIVKYFQEWQTCTQFSGYTYAINGNFEGLRLGTNAVSRLNVPLQLPLLLVENMRALAGRRYQATGKRGERYVQWYLPCIGLFEDSEFFDLPFPLGSVEVQMFNPTPRPDAAGLNVVDGNTNSGPRDLNSQVIQDAVFYINNLIKTCSAYSGGTAFPEGSSDFNLLAFTRYDEDVDLGISESDFEKRGTWQTRGLIPSLKKEYERRKVVYESTRTKSSPPFVWKPRTSSISMMPRAFSSAMVITKELMTVLQTLVVPSVITYSQNYIPAGTQFGFQTAFSEPQSYKVNSPGGPLPTGSDTVYLNLYLTGKDCAPGLAADPTGEVNRVMKILQETGKGGFLEAALSGILTFAERI